MNDENDQNSPQTLTLEYVKDHRLLEQLTRTEL